jgi:cytoskeletal protein CcmA (bactofilin family)
MRPLMTRPGFAGVLPIAFALTLCGTARSQTSSNFKDYSLFGARGVDLQGATVKGGIVGSNNDVAVGSFSSFSALAGGGELIAQGPTVSGSVTFNGNVSLGGATVGGPINSGKDVTVTSFGSTHSITAGGDVTFNGSTIAGNVTAGNDFTLGTSVTFNGNAAANNNVFINGSTIHGNLTYGNSLFFGSFGGSITGTTTVAPVVANPSTFTPLTLPTAIPFTSGGANLTTGGSQANPLAPGSYGDLHLGSFQDLYLGPGNYYFSSIEILNSQSIHLVGLTAQNSINIFVTGNFTEGALSSTTVDGLAFGSADPTLAKNVFIETLGNFTQDSLGGDQTFGTIFAPNGDVNFGQFSSVTGSVLAGGRVLSSVGLTENFQPTNAIPEPPALLMTGVGLIVAGAYALRRRVAPAGS